MEKEIVLCGKKVNYTLQYKNVKNINLRIREGGRIFVSASKRVKEERIEAFLISKAEWIISAVERVKSKTESAFDGKSILLFGKKLPLSIKEGRKNSFSQNENGLSLFLVDTSDEKRKEKLLKAFYRTEAERIIFPICEKAYRDFSIKNLPFPEIKYRYMKTRWGSCHTKKGILTFNTALVKASHECIEYVVFHEFSHFLHPNHSREFYKTLSLFIPDYKERKKKLKEIPI